MCSPRMVPKRLHDTGQLPGAIGPNTLHLFRHGDGAFEDGPVSPALALAVDINDHGTVQPSAIMPYADYRAAIVATRSDWVSGEGDPDE